MMHIFSDLQSTLGRSLVAATVVAVLLGASSAAMAAGDYTDDTEVFFDQSNNTTTNPNVLFILDTGGEMGKTLAGAATNPATGATKTRMQVVKDALVKVLEDLSQQNVGVNVGLMRLSVNGAGNSAAAKGGMIVKEIAPLGTDLTSLKNTLCTRTSANGLQDVLNPAQTANCDTAYPNGNKNGGGGKPVFATQDLLGDGSIAAPVTEMYFEAYKYFAGSDVVWGGSLANVGPSYQYPSVDASLTAPGSATYKSPIKQACQANFIIMLSVGIMAEDNGNDSGNVVKNIESQPNISTYTGTGTGPVASGGYKVCSRNYLPNTTTEISFTGKKVSPCGDDLAYYMDQYGVGPSKIPVTTYVIGFDVNNAAGSDAAKASALLQLIARAGGGKFFNATDEDTLVDVFRGILDEIVIQNASFTSPAVAVNSFNRTQNLDSLYMSVFAPKTSMRWPGNVKKYKLASNGDILDANGDSAVGSNGFFRSGRRSYWTPSGTADGEDVAKGGAASQMPAPGSRKIYTNATSETTYATSDSSLTSRKLSDLKTTGTPGLTAPKQNTLFGLSTTCTRTSPIASPSCPSGDQLIDWAYGMDVADLVPRNGNNNYTEARKDMGDPLHGRPSVVIYGGTTSSKDIDDARVYAVTNDGYLHSFDAKTGVEQWAFVPYNQLQRLLRVYQNNSMNPRAPLGLDGTIRVLKIDKCSDGVIEPANVTCGNDRVYLFFGMRRGGNYYYALDVSYKDAPKLLWMAGPGTDSTSGLTQLPLVGQTWSTPTVTRATVPGKTQNSDKYVVVFGGGYDAAKEDGTAAKAYVTDTVGTAIYMVDAVSGALLWWAGPSNSPSLTLTGMTNSIPADVRAIDFTSDGLVDIMYAADLGGRVWRFDVDNSADSTANFIKGGVFANLGGTGAEGARRFFVAPDVSFVKQGSTTWFNIAIGSGNRELPVTDTTTDDKFYSLRDYNKLTPYTWTGTDAWAPITDADLTDVTPTAVPTCDLAIPPNCTTTYQRVTVAADGKGWKMPLNYFDGEKVITESRTFENTVFFSSFYPKIRTGSDDTDSDSCTTTKGYNNFYAISAFDGSPCASCIAGLVAKGKTAIAAGTGVILKQPGIAPEPVFLFPTPDGTSTTRVPPVCLVGAESCGSFSSYEPKRTYWWQKGAE